MVESVSKIRKGLESNWLEEQATSAPYSVGGLGKLLWIMESNFPVFTQLLGRVLCMVNNYLCLTAICLQLEEPRKQSLSKLPGCRA